MKETPLQGNGPVHQTVAGKDEFKSGGKTSAVEFPEPRRSPPAGSATFRGVGGDPSGWVERLAGAQPQPAPCSHPQLPPRAKARAFCPGIWGEARTLPQVA